MAMNGLRNLAQVLETGANEIHVPKNIGAKAVNCISRMLDFAAKNKVALRGNSGD
jgi:quinolinate synthase